jgi:hypothetical protein
LIRGQFLEIYTSNPSGWGMDMFVFHNDLQHNKSWPKVIMLTGLRFYKIPRFSESSVRKTPYFFHFSLFRSNDTLCKTFGRMSFNRLWILIRLRDWPTYFVKLLVKQASTVNTLCDALHQSRLMLSRPKY